EQRISLKDSYTGYKPALLYQKVFPEDVKSFNIPKLIPLTFEAKYPQSKLLVEENQPYRFLVDLLSTKDVSMEETAKILKKGRSLFIPEIPLLQMSMSKIEEIYRNYDINPYEVIEQAHNATLAVVQDLHLPGMLEKKIIGILKATPIMSRNYQESDAKREG